MDVLRVSGVKYIAERNSPVGVLRVSGVKRHSREKQPSGCGVLRVSGVNNSGLCTGMLFIPYMAATCQVNI